MPSIGMTIGYRVTFVVLFHELQSNAGGFLGNSLYLLLSSAVIGVPTVGVNS